VRYLIIIGAVVRYTGSFEWALVIVAVTPLLATVAYLPVVGEVERVEIAAGLVRGVNA
jgi:ACS family glucarate transporter-like MFS transporter